MAGALLALVGGFAYTAGRLNLTHFRLELQFRGAYRTALRHVLADPKVRDGLRCGPVSAPNHKLIPDIRWVANLPESKVVARSDPKQARRIHHGIALYVSGRYAMFRQAFVTAQDDPRSEVPLSGFDRIATSRYYGAYVRCPGRTS
jgi:hypothetical protein